jgi:hypothetical protein
MTKSKTIEIHLNNFQRKRVTWKPHYHNSPTWAFLKMNDSQLVDIFQNEIM